MEKVKKGIGFLPLIFIIIFLGLYFAYQNGYYERVTRDKILLTNKSIEQFEQDVSEGKDVTIEDYLEEEKNYSTKTSKISLTLSSKLENMLDKGIKYLFRKLSSMVE